MKKYITWILFIMFILMIIIYNISLANDVRLYFENEQNGSEEHEILNEDEYSVDIYAETTQKVIGGFQFQLLYSENIELIDVISWDIGEVNINVYSGKVVGYKNENSQSTVGKVRLCTLIFKIVEESEDSSYDVKIDFNSGYSKVKDINGDEIVLHSDKESVDLGNEENENNSSGNTGMGEKENNIEENTIIVENGKAQGGSSEIQQNGNTLGENIGVLEDGNIINKNNGSNTSDKNINNQIQKNDSIDLVEENGVYKDEKGENIIPKTGEGSSIIIINVILISITILLGGILISYKGKGI